MFCFQCKYLILNHVPVFHHSEYLTSCGGPEGGKCSGLVCVCDVMYTHCLCAIHLFKKIWRQHILLPLLACFSSYFPPRNGGGEEEAGCGKSWRPFVPFLGRGGSECRRQHTRGLKETFPSSPSRSPTESWVKAHPREGHRGIGSYPFMLTSSPFHPLPHVLLSLPLLVLVSLGIPTPDMLSAPPHTARAEALHTRGSLLSAAGATFW